MTGPAVTIESPIGPVTIVERDGEAAAQLMRDHLLTVQRRILDRMVPDHAVA